MTRSPHSSTDPAAPPEPPAGPGREPSVAPTVDLEPNPPAAHAVEGPRELMSDLDKALGQLKQQQAEFEERCRQLQTLRQKLEQRVEQDHALLARRQQEQQAAGGPLAAENTYLAEAKRHIGTRHSVVIKRMEQRPAPPDRAAEANVDEIAERYRRRIQELEREKHVVQQRMLELQGQVRTWQEHGAAAPVDSSAPSRWRLPVAVVLGIGAAAGLFYIIPFQYEVRTSLFAEAEKVSLEQLQAHRRALASMAGVAASEAAPALLENPAVRVEPKRHLLELIATTRNRQQGPRHLQAVATRFTDDLEQQRRSTVTDLLNRLKDLEEQKAASRKSYDALLSELSGQRQAVEGDNPKMALDGLFSKMARTRKQLRELQKEAQGTRTRLHNIEGTDPPELPAVDSKSRQAAESQDVYLKQDLEALRVRLTQLRQHLLLAHEQSVGPLRTYTTTTEGLGAYLANHRLKLENHRLVSSLDEVAAKAADITQTVLGFQQSWDRLFQRLQQLEINPRSKECLEIQRDLENGVREFNLGMDERLQKLQTSYQQFSQNLQSPAEHFELRNGLVREIRDLVNAQLAFADFSSRIIPTKDYQLDAILHSAVGLTRRVRDRQRAIEAELSASKRHEMQRDHQLQVLDQRERLADLDQRKDELVTQLLSQQDQLNALIPSLEGHAAASTELIHTQERAEELLSRIDRLKGEQASLQSRLAQTEALADPFQLGPAQVGGWPVDALDDASMVALGGLSSGVLVFMLLSLVNGRRPRPIAAAVPSA